MVDPEASPWFAIGLRRRCKLPEVMDDPGLDGYAHYQALRGLSRLNWLSRTARTFWHELTQLAAPSNEAPIRVLDLACGGGDIAIRLARIALRRSVAVTIDGCDLSARAVKFARAAAAQQGVSCRFFPLNVVTEPLPEGYDVFVTSLFLHHLEDSQLPIVLRHMADAARRGFVVDDLRRSVAGYLLAHSAGHLVSKSPVVHGDALLSVRAAFTMKEIEAFLDQAELTGYTLRRCFPCRFLLSWSKDSRDAS
jgi:2-polyprenyl-3-methyl-5-hydroxy-6-metoxy-1,4-benzoquinol methylase